MFRILRAFAWLRWRVLLNSLERTGARDRLERMSLAVDQLAPIMAGVILVPSLLGISVLSAFAGAAVARGSGRALTFEALRYLTLAVSGLAIAGPLLMPVMERANPVRLLLLPIQRGTLYLAQAAGTLADPWTLMALPLVLFLPLGLAVGGAPQAAMVAFVAGLLLLVVIVGLSTVTSCVAQLVLRDRRRGELVALAFILLLPLIGIGSSAIGRSPQPRSASQEHAAQQRHPSLPAEIARRAFWLLPSEQYVRAARAGTLVNRSNPASSVAVLLLTALALHGAGVLAFGRLLASPGSVGPRRVARGGARARVRIPWISPAAGAIATAQVRLAVRTPRGRSTLLSPVVAFAVLAVLAMQGGQLSWIPQTGAGLAALSALFAVMTGLPLATNQFAIDGAGLTLELLSPATEQDLLTGKTVANGLTAGAPAALCMLAALALFPGGSPALWLAVPIGLVGVYLLLAPALAFGSILFPRVVNLNSIGSGSNAHFLAGLMGLAGMGLAAMPPILLALLATGWLNRPTLAPLFLAGWCLVAYAAHRFLFRLLRLLLARRRENLSLVAG